MKIIEIAEEPIEFFPYINIKPGSSSYLPKEERIIHRRFPIFRGKFEADQSSVKALIVASDLQGNIEDDGELYLMGEYLPDFINDLLQVEMPHLDAKDCGVLLCGDLYADLESRSANGDVREVYEEFKYHFKWVIGVAGNHDTFGDRREEYDFKNQQNPKLLIRNKCEKDGLQIAGLSGIIGRPGKNFRVASRDYEKDMKKLLEAAPDIFLTHANPNYSELGFIGNELIRDTLEAGPPTLNICGHCHWSQHLVELDNGTQVLNSDGKVFILEKK